MRILLTTDFGEGDLEALRAEFPGTEFSRAASSDEALLDASDVDAIIGGRIWPEVIAAAGHLKLIHIRYAGVNSLPLDEIASRGIALTNGSGTHGPQIAENLLAMMLAFATRLPSLVEAKDRREWIADRVRDEKFELGGQTLLVIGLGDLGLALARRARAMGMYILGIRRTPGDAPDGVDELLPRDRLIDALGRADHAALCLPLTPETTGIIGELEIRAMKSTAYLYNAGRGQSIERTTLIRALQEGWIAGAGLDVTDPEPLPPDDPLWSLPNVILTQHTGGWSPRIDERGMELLKVNLGRFLSGRPLRNVVDPALGY